MWLQDGNYFRPRDKGADRDNLPPAVFTVHSSMMGMYLEVQQDKFEFPYKLYGNSQFPERVAHTFKETKGNLGVMLTGLKGTGKTVEAEMICNLLNMPVILVQSTFEGTIVPFLNRIKDDIVVFVDEYEKIFEKSNDLLSLMDGALRTKYRRMFLFTSNEMYVSDAMLNRPSRLLYIKRFGNLDEAMIMEIVSDLLPDETMQRAAVKYLAGLEIITVDIVKTVCAEMLRFNELPDAFKAIMNVKERERALHQTVYQLLGGKEVLLSASAFIDPIAHTIFSMKFKGDPGYNVDDDYESVFSVRDSSSHDNWQQFGQITGVDKEAKTITTDQGIFKIVDCKIHPSLMHTYFTHAAV